MCPTLGAAGDRVWRFSDVVEIQGSPRRHGGPNAGEPPATQSATAAKTEAKKLNHREDKRALKREENAAKSTFLDGTEFIRVIRAIRGWFHSVDCVDKVLRGEKKTGETADRNLLTTDYTDDTDQKNEGQTNTRSLCGLPSVPQNLRTPRRR
jgi:hypothetical protein